MASHAKTASIGPRRLSSGDYVDRCDDCGTVTRGCTIDELLAAACACQSRRIVRYVAELVCLACGRPIGSISVPRRDSRLLARHTLRCSHCGGMPLVDEFYPVSDYPDVPLSPAKRGRPPGRKPALEEGRD